MGRPFHWAPRKKKGQGRRLSQKVKAQRKAARAERHQIEKAKKLFRQRVLRVAEGAPIDRRPKRLSQLEESPSEVAKARAASDARYHERVAALYPPNRPTTPPRESDFEIWRRGAWMQ